MAGNLKEIKEKITSTGNLKKITRAMEMVARSKMKRSVDAALAARPYSEKVLSLLEELSVDQGKYTHPLLAAHEQTARILVVHIASEKGLCGGYNAHALRGLQEFLGNKNLDDVHIVSVGKYASKHTEKVNAFHIQDFSFGETITVDEVETLAEFLMDRFMEEKYSHIFISYMNFKTVFSQEYTTKTLLPLSKESLREMIRTAGAEEEYHEIDPKDDLFSGFFEKYRYEPSKQFILESILPGLVTTQVYQALLEAGASEHSARMVAMKNATDNATKFGEELTLKYNRARQASITSEIIEIASGADAV